MSLCFCVFGNAPCSKQFLRKWTTETLFAVTLALVPCPSASLPDIVVAPALVLCPSASTLTCRRCRCLLSSLAHQHPHACRCRCAGSCVPCPSAFALACHCCCCRCHQWQRTHPADCHRQGLRHPCRPFNLCCPVPPQSLLPPSPLCHRRRRQSRAFWAKYLFTYRGSSYQ